MRAGLSQERLGVMAGIDEASASARMNQYERAKHAPDRLTIQNIAAVLQVPVAYFHADDDTEAEMLRMFHTLPLQAREELVETMRQRMPKTGD